MASLIPVRLRMFKLTIGIAIGYEDKAHGINKFTSARDPISETVRFFS